MFPSHSPQQAVIASQLAVELAAYDQGLGALLQERWDPEAYRELCDAFDRMQMQAQALPRMAGAWTELLISRVELTQALWSRRTPARLDGRVVALHAQHRARLQDVLRRCARFLPAQPAAFTAPADPGNPTGRAR